MIRIETLKEIEDLILSYKSKNTFSNNYLLPESYHQFISDGKMYYIEKNNNLVFFVDKKSHYQLYYHINNLCDYFNFNEEKPVCMEILYRGEANLPVEMINYWENCGFKKHLIRDSYAVSYNEFSSQEYKSETDVCYAKSKDEVLFTQQIIENSFDKYTGDILDLDEVTRYVNNNKVLCAYTENTICGVLQFDIVNKVVWLGHLAVHSDFRGKKIGRELVRRYIEDNRTNDKTRYQLWVLNDNPEAKRLYESFGFKYVNKSTISMLME